MILTFDTSAEFQYHWCGKFTSPSSDWIHMTRNLGDYELIVVTRGVLYIADHIQEYAVHPGEYLLMAPTPFQHGTRSGDCDFYWMHFSHDPISGSPRRESGASQHPPGRAETIPPQRTPNETGLHSTSAQSPSADLLTLPVTGALASPERIIILMKQLQDSDRRYKEPALNRFLCSAVLAEISAQSRHTLRRDKQLKEQLYGDIQDYVSWHIQENLTVSEIATHFGYNEKYLTTFFKKYAGITLKQYLLQTKMEAAKTSLSETTQPISQIAYSLGFSDAHNFSNAFRKVTGLSPSQFRASYNIHNVFRK